MTHRTNNHAFDDTPPRELIYADAEEFEVRDSAPLDEPNADPADATPSGPPDEPADPFRQLAARGWRLVPIPFREKGPRIKGWQKLRIEAGDFDRYFHAPCNAGVILGLPDAYGRYLIDVDLDSPEAVQLADQYLPPTDCVFGRQSKPASHRFYYVRHNIPTKKYTDSNKKVIVELRGAGCQTVVPGSVHPSGERIEWVKDAEPAEIDPTKLLADMEKLAEACGWRPPASVVPVPAPQPVNGNLADRPVVADAPGVDWYGRCERYLEQVPESISGQVGHRTLLRACCEIYRFGFDGPEARRLADWFNANKCSPPWSERELEHKLSDAKKLVDADGEFGCQRKPGPHTQPLADAAPQTAAAVPVPDWEPMPLDCLPDVVREYVQAVASALGCPPEYVVMPLLAVLASAIGNSRRVELKASWSEPAVIWACVIAQSGTLKSPAHEKAVSLLWSRQQRLIADYQREMRSYEEAKQAYEDERRNRARTSTVERVQRPTEPILVRLYTSDTTIEALCALLAQNPRGELLERDELAGWFQSFDRYTPNAGSDEPAWLSMHRAGPVVIDRKTGVRFTNVPRAAVSICGTIQPGTLARCLKPASYQSGLVARFLFVAPPTLTKRWSEATVPDAVINRMQALVDHLLDLQMDEKQDTDGNVTLEPVCLPLNADARKLWIEFYNSHAQDQERIEDESERSARSKLEAYAARLALIFALCQNPDATAVDALSMQSAIRLTRWLCAETRRVYAMLAGPAGATPEAEILTWLAGRDGTATLRELRDFKRCYRAPGKAEQAVEKLVATGRVVWDIPDAGSSGGRPPARFRLK